MVLFFAGSGHGFVQTLIDWFESGVARIGQLLAGAWIRQVAADGHAMQLTVMLELQKTHATGPRIELLSDSRFGITGLRSLRAQRGDFLVLSKPAQEIRKFPGGNFQFA